MGKILTIGFSSTLVHQGITWKVIHRETLG
jgi:hypothetical protein